MAFKDFPNEEQGVKLLQRSLERGRLSHSYLFGGEKMDKLEMTARALAKTLNCAKPVQSNGIAIDCCDTCLSCRKIENATHADIHWVRPESKLRLITIDQMRGLMQEINLKPTEAEYKVAVIVGADRMNTSAANAFLKTLEEPPAKSVLILLSTEPQRILETILSRCLRLKFGTGELQELEPARKEWLGKFSELAATEQKSLLGRYRLMDVLLAELTGMKTRIEESLTARSPLERYDDVEKNLREKWEDELSAAIEAEYRRERADLLVLLQHWLRDVWLRTLRTGREMLNFPDLAGGEQIARRISPTQAMENLQVMEATQRLLHTNVQEALALEVGLLKLNL